MEEDTLLVCRKTGEDSNPANSNEHLLLALGLYPTQRTRAWFATLRSFFRSTTGRGFQVTKWAVHDTSEKFSESNEPIMSKLSYVEYEL